MLLTLLTRVILITLAFAYITPYVAGVKFHGDLCGALIASVVFNAGFWGLECLLAVMVFGVNIGTLGLGAFLTGSIKFAAALLTPSLALFGASELLPGVVHISHYFPNAIIFGFVLGGILWASVPASKNK